MKVKDKEFLSTSITFTILFSLMLSIFNSPAPIRRYSNPSTLNPSNHPTISIIGETGLELFEDKTGNGTPTDPYIIQDLIINPAYGEDGISIEYTTKYIDIINCTIAGTYFDDGICLYFLSNVRVINCTIIGNGCRAIFTQECSNIQILNTSIELTWNPSTSMHFQDSVTGISFYECSDMFIHNNEIISNRINGILVGTADLSSNVTISNNTLSGCTINIYPVLMTNQSIMLDGTNRVNGGLYRLFINSTNITSANLTGTDNIILYNCSNSTISGISFLKIHLEACTNVTIQNCSGLIWLYGSSYNNITNNTCDYYGEWIIRVREESYYNIIKDNNVTNGIFCGMAFHNSAHNNVTGNRIFNNFEVNLYIYGSYNNIFSNLIHGAENGIFLRQSSSNVIFNNTVVNHTNVGIIFDDWGQQNEVYMNKFVNNTGANGYVDPTIGQTDNFWDDGVNGNYWDDYFTHYPFATNDGYNWNLFYTRNRTFDKHPLVTPFVGDVRPAANFTMLNTSIEYDPGTALHFNYTGTSWGNEPTTLSWDFGDGTTSFNSTYVTHNYTMPGNYTVNCSLIDVDGDVSSEIKPGIVVIKDKLPFSNFTVNDTLLLEGEWINCTYNGTLGDEPNIVTWNLGDGTFNATVGDVLHQYNSSGNFTISLNITDMDLDESKSTSATIIVLSLLGDEDGDGLTNEIEMRQEFTDPFDWDSDDDGYSDGKEIEEGTNPLDENDHPITPNNGGNDDKPVDWNAILFTVIIVGLSIVAVAVVSSKIRR